MSCAGADAQDAEEKLEDAEGNTDGQGQEGGRLEEAGFDVLQGFLIGSLFHFARWRYR